MIDMHMGCDQRSYGIQRKLYIQAALPRGSGGIGFCPLKQATVDQELLAALACN